MTLNVEEVLGHDRRALVDGLARPVEHAAEHVLADGNAHDVARELAVRVLGVDARRALEDLHDGLAAADLQHLPAPGAPVAQCQVNDLCITWFLFVCVFFVFCFF